MIEQKRKAAGGNRAANQSRYKNTKGSTKFRQLDFKALNETALAVLPALLVRWLPDGFMRGQEYIARNPRRVDQQAGSFSINMRTGKWADFASGDSGGDVISLAAYLSGVGQYEAACELAGMLGVRHDR